MTANPNWPRWIFASIATALKAVATTDGHKVLVEGLDERTDDILKSDLWAEIRATGPFIRPLVGEFECIVDANVLLKCTGDRPAYDITRIAGLYAATLLSPIPVYNYGKELGDYVPDLPDTLIHLGCLDVRPTKAEAVKVFHIGRIDKTDRTRECVVDATLQIFLP